MVDVLLPLGQNIGDGVFFFEKFIDRATSFKQAEAVTGLKQVQLLFNQEYNLPAGGGRVNREVQNRTTDARNFSHQPGTSYDSLDLLGGRWEITRFSFLEGFEAEMGRSHHFRAYLHTKLQGTFKMKPQEPEEFPARMEGEGGGEGGGGRG